MDGNDIGAEGAAALADALKENTTLTALYLNGNDIGAEGAAALVDALKENTTLTTLLYLNGNDIDDEGAAAVRMIDEYTNRNQKLARGS